jgi:hypothetical protein
MMAMSTQYHSEALSAISNASGGEGEEGSQTIFSLVCFRETIICLAMSEERVRESRKRARPESGGSTSTRCAVQHYSDSSTFLHRSLAFFRGLFPFSELMVCVLCCRDGQNVPLSKRGLTPLSSDFVAECRWLNKLPPVPHSSKMLIYPFESDRFVKYRQPTSLEVTHRFDLHTETDLALDLNLSDIDAWEGPLFLSSLQSGAKRQKTEKTERDLATLALSSMPPDDKHIISDPRERHLVPTTPVQGSLDVGGGAAAFASSAALRATDALEESDQVIYVREILGAFEHVDSLAHERSWKHPNAASSSTIRPVAVYNVIPNASLWPSGIYDVQLESSHAEVLDRRDEMLLKGFKVRAASDVPLAEDIMAVIAPSHSHDPASGYSWIKEYNFAKIAEAESNLIVFVPPSSVSDDSTSLQTTPVTFKPLDGRIQLKKRSRPVTAAPDETRIITVQSIPQAHNPHEHMFMPPM